MTNVLVTGGAGFVGSKLCEGLLKKGYCVYSLDNYFTGSVESHHDGVTYIAGDVRDLEKLCPRELDVIYHLGEYSRVEQSFEDIALLWEYNRNGIISVLEYCRTRGAKLIYAGSSTKFSDGGSGRNQSPYAWSKASNTDLVKCYGEWFGVQYAITYFYNVYGDGEISSGRYATVIGLFTEKLRRGLPLPVVTPGTQRRNFTHVDDIVAGLILVGEEGYGDEFGIGVDESYSILDVAAMFDGVIEMVPPRRGNRMGGEVHSQKTRALGWKPNHNLPHFIEKIRCQI